MGRNRVNNTQDILCHTYDLTGLTLFLAMLFLAPLLQVWFMDQQHNHHLEACKKCRFFEAMLFKSYLRDCSANKVQEAHLEKYNHYSSLS